MSLYIDKYGAVGMTDILGSTDCRSSGHCYNGPEEPLTIRVREQERLEGDRQYIANPVFYNNRSEFAGAIVMGHDSTLMLDVYTPSYKVSVGKAPASGIHYKALTPSISNGTLTISKPGKGYKVAIFLHPVNTIHGETTRIRQVYIV